MSGALEDRRRLFKVAAGVILLAFIVPWGPILWVQGIVGWEQRADARFYADCAGRFLETGQFRWAEIYPVALKRGARVDMAWTAPAHPMAIAAVMRASGLPAQEATVAVGVSAFLACLAALVIAGGILGGDVCFVLALASAFFLLPQSWDFAVSGGSESLSQLFLVGSALLAALWLRRPSGPLLAALLAWSAFGCLARPQNQFLLLALVVLVRAAPAGGRIRFLAAWAAAVLAPMLLAAWLARGADLVFPRTFCFLVGTPAHPGHSLFREYFPCGFGWADLWAGRDQFPAKAAVGWRLLKMYWPGWLVPGGLLVAACAFGRARLLALAALLTLGASVFFGAAGFLVPRYWEALEPLVLVVLLACIAPYAERLPRKLAVAAMLVVSVVFARLLVADLRTLVIPGKPELHRSEPPSAICEALPSSGLVAADRPSLVIETLRRPVLLCPETPEVLHAIERDVAPVEAIVFSPDLSGGELAAWAGRGGALEAAGFRSLAAADGWVLWRRPPATSPAPTSPATNRPGP